MLEHEKYVFIKDGLGELVGTIQNAMPNSENSVFINALASRADHLDQWSKSVKGLEMGINLSKCDKFILYKDPEEFFTEFMDAIL